MEGRASAPQVPEGRCSSVLPGRVVLCTCLSLLGLSRGALKERDGMYELLAPASVLSSFLLS